MGTQGALCVYNDGRTSASDLLLSDFKFALDVDSGDGISEGTAHRIIADATEVSNRALGVCVHLCAS